MPGELAGGPTAMADRLLLVRRQLGHGPLVLRPGVNRDEGRVVAEAPTPPGLRRERPLAAPLEGALRPVLADQGDRADVGNPAVVLRADLVQQLVQVLLVGGVLPGIASRAHPGPPIEAVRFDPGVVR